VKNCLNCKHGIKRGAWIEGCTLHVSPMPLWQGCSHHEPKEEKPPCTERS
jgi:hypothetical protein